MTRLCKDCIRAKEKQGYKLLYCGKHRIYITEYTMAETYRKDRKPCPDYEARK